MTGRHACRNVQRPEPDETNDPDFKRLAFLSFCCTQSSCFHSNAQCSNRGMCRGPAGIPARSVKHAAYALPCVQHEGMTTPCNGSAFQASFQHACMQSHCGLANALPPHSSLGGGRRPGCTLPPPAGGPRPGGGGGGGGGHPSEHYIAPIRHKFRVLMGAALFQMVRTLGRGVGECIAWYGSRPLQACCECHISQSITPRSEDITRLAQLPHWTEAQEVHA